MLQKVLSSVMENKYVRGTVFVLQDVRYYFKLLREKRDRSKDRQRGESRLSNQCRHPQELQKKKIRNGQKLKLFKKEYLLVTFLDEDNCDDHTVDTKNTSHDNGNDGFHDKVRLEDTHGSDTNSRLSGTISSTEICLVIKKI